MAAKKEFYVLNVYNTNSNTSLNEYGYPYVCDIHRSIESILKFLSEEHDISLSSIDDFDTDIYGNLSYVKEGSRDFYINVKIFACKIM